MQAHNQGEAAVACLGGEQSRCALKWKWNCYTPTAIEEGICVGRGTTILDRHCGRSFGFALLQSEIYKKEMLGEVYSKEAPDGGKTKGTSHHPPWGTCTPKLHFSALLLILSTRSPLECTAPSPAHVSPAQSFKFPFFFSILSEPTRISLACLLPIHPAAPLVCIPPLPYLVPTLTSNFLSHTSCSPLSLPPLPLCLSAHLSLSAATCWLAQSKTLY